MQRHRRFAFHIPFLRIGLEEVLHQNKVVNQEMKRHELLESRQITEIPN